MGLLRLLVSIFILGVPLANGLQRQEQGRSSSLLRASAFEALFSMTAVCKVDDPKQCNQRGLCEVVDATSKTTACKCEDPFVGPSCETNYLEEMHFDTECEDMMKDEVYLDICKKATRTGALCAPYKLTWRHLCYETCVRMKSLSCSPDTREQFCFGVPKCPTICTGMMNSYCKYTTTTTTSPSTTVKSF